MNVSGYKFGEFVKTFVVAAVLAAVTYWGTGKVASLALAPNTEKVALTPNTEKVAEFKEGSDLERAVYQNAQDIAVLKKDVAKLKEDIADMRNDISFIRGYLARDSKG